MDSFPSDFSAEWIRLTPREALSGIFGTISLIASMVVLLPQLAENYINGSAEAISLPFLTIWLLGDIANLSGAFWAHLLPTVTTLAIYFCIADSILILQCLYYRVRNREGKAGEAIASAAGDVAPEAPSEEQDEEAGETDSLLSRRESLIVKILAEPDPATATKAELRRDWLKDAVCILLVCGIGAGVWAIAWKTGLWSPVPIPRTRGANDNGSRDDRAPATPVAATPIGAEILGYASALAYLGARIPQIIKNYRKRSCEGLSMLFFLLSLLGNLTYGAGIFFHSTRPTYTIKNLPWVLGSAGTMLEDLTIFIQFQIYGKGKIDPQTKAETVDL